MREHMVIAWGHKRVVTSLFSIEKHYYQKCSCGFKVTSPNKTFIETLMGNHLEAHRGAATRS